MSQKEFINDEVLKKAFIRSIEVIGEASKHIPHNIRKKYPKIEWKAIAGTRDKLIHDYFGVDYDLVWDIIINKIPLLKTLQAKQLNRAVFPFLG